MSDELRAAAERREAEAEPAGGLIRDHPFVPQGTREWLCGYTYPIGDAEPPRLCGLGEAAHVDTTMHRARRPEV